MLHSIISWNYWDAWLQKLFVQLISIKVLALVATTILCVLHYISDTTLATVFGIIFGIKGAFTVADIIKNGGNNKEMIDKI